MMERHRVLTEFDPDLPPNYKRVQYIQAASNAFIATNYVPTQGDEFEIKFMIDSIATMNCLLSAGTGSYQLVALGYSEHGLGFYYKYFSSGGALNVDTACSTGTWYTMTVNTSGTFTVNGVTGTIAYGEELDGDSKTLYVFRRRNGTYPFIGKLASFKVTNNGTKKLNLIPCISGSSVGAYDTVSKTFYTSGSNLEAFTAGAIV